jgi:hypothetical protein
MIMLIRRLALFFAMIFGVIGAQFPEYAQQYRQRLGGAIDELNTIIARFDQDAAQSGLTEHDGITRLQQNPDVFVQGRGDQMNDIVARRDKLVRQAQTYTDSGRIKRVWELATQADPYIAWRAYETFEPGVPVTTEGFVSAAIGFVVGWGLIRLLGWPIERHHRRRLRLRALPEREFAA